MSRHHIGIYTAAAIAQIIGDESLCGDAMARNEIRNSGFPIDTGLGEIPSNRYGEGILVGKSDYTPSQLEALKRRQERKLKNKEKRR